MLKSQVDQKTRLFGKIDRLVKIKIKHQTFEVPENLELLRCFQYLEFNISFENFCWNASCENCAANIQTANAKQPERVLCCQYPSEEGLTVFELPVGVEIPEQS